MFQDAGSLDIASPCSAVSSMTKAFVIRLSLQADDPVGFHVDVKDVFEHINIIDTNGVPVSVGSSSGDVLGHASPSNRLTGDSPEKRFGCQQGLLMQCSVGRCSAPPRLGGSGARPSLWSQISGACVPGPDLFDEPSVGEVLVT